MRTYAAVGAVFFVTVLAIIYSVWPGEETPTPEMAVSQLFVRCSGNDQVVRYTVNTGSTSYSLQEGCYIVATPVEVLPESPTQASSSDLDE